MNGFRQGPEFGTPDLTFAGFQIAMIYVEGDGEYGTMQAVGKGNVPLQPQTTTLCQHYGFSATPPEGTEGIAFRLQSGQVVQVAENCIRPAQENKQSFIWDIEGNQVRCMADDGGVELQARTGQKVSTLSPTFLGSLTANEALLKGTTLHTAFSTFASAWSTALADYWTTKTESGFEQAVDGYITDVDAALDALITSLVDWLSIKHKLDE